jgi:hypothetical protein
MTGRMGMVAICLVTLASGLMAQPAAAPASLQTAREAYNRMPDTPGSGPYRAFKQIAAGLPDHVLYRPEDLAPFGANRKLPILLWGNGGCLADGASARLHLAEIASHGYLAIAPGGIRSGPGASSAPNMERSDPRKLPPVETTASALIAGLDWALRENERRASPFYHKLDPGRVAVAGHSCGGLQALQVAADPRIRAVIINNSGIFADGSNPIPGIEVHKALLGSLHTPILYILGGPADVAYPNGMDDFAHIDRVPVIVANIASGHGGTFAQPNGGVVARVSVDWLDWQLKGDEKAARRFAGPNCGLCTDPQWTVQRKRID